MTPSLSLTLTVTPKGARDLREIDVARDGDVDHVVDLARVRVKVRPRLRLRHRSGLRVRSCGRPCVP